MRGKTHGLLEIHAAVLFFGLSGLFGKFLSLPPSVIVSGRTFFASIALGFTIVSLKQSLRIRSKNDFGMFILLGGILSTHWTTFFHSIQISTVAVGLITFSTFPVFVTFMEPFFSRERLRVFDILTATLVFCGLILVIPSFDFDNHISRGALWGTLSGFTFALLSILNRRYVRIYSPLVITFYQNAFATLILLPFLLTGSRSIGSKELVLLALLGVFCTALSHGLFIKGLRYVRAQLASVTAGLEPVYGVLFAFLFLGEVPSLRIALGGIIILGTTLFASTKMRHNYEKKPIVSKSS